MNIEIEHNPNDILLGFQAIRGEFEDDNGNMVDIDLYSIGFIFFTITLIVQ